MCWKITCFTYWTLELTTGACGPKPIIWPATTKNFLVDSSACKPVSGYRLRPAWVWQRKRYGTSELIVCVANRGVAGVPGVLWLQLESPDKKLVLQGALDAGHPHGGGIRQASFLLPKDYSGKVQLSAQIEIRPGVKKPLSWACEQPLKNDGSITIDLKSENGPGWRKGV